MECLLQKRYCVFILLTPIILVMNSHQSLIDVTILTGFKSAMLCFISAFVMALLVIPPVISIIKKNKLLDKPNARKEHTTPVPTMGGIAIAIGMLVSLAIWCPFPKTTAPISFFFALIGLIILGIYDDLKDLSAKYKFVVQFALAALISIAGLRINSFEGLLGLEQLPIQGQHLLTVLAIVGITNAFNLIDGIDGLAGSLGFMSLMVLGIFLTLAGDANTALIAFALAGSLMAFLYFNLNPARIFMGDTGSLLLGFVVGVLSVRFMQVNAVSANPVVPFSPVFSLSIVFIPVFDTLRVFATRMWNGRSPFHADKTHIHHLLTNQGFNHAFAARSICFLHALILLTAYWMKNVKQEIVLLVLLCIMLIGLAVLKNLGTAFKNKRLSIFQKPTL
ncbi:MAG: glycosyltransferase family 4 protein [Bacteroidota bacterium]